MTSTPSHPQRLALIRTAMFCAWVGTCAGPAAFSAEENVLQPFAVVARRDQPLLAGDKAVATARKGDVLTAYRAQEDLYAVRNAEGKIGWVKQGDVAKFADAVDLFSELITAAPTNARLYALRGFSWWGRNEPDKAIADYSLAIKLGDQSASIYEYRGMCQSVLGKHDDALADYTEATRRGADGVSLIASRAAAYLAKGEFAKAIEDYDAVIKREPQRFDILYQRGVAKKSLGGLEEAIADFSAALQLQPDYVLSLNGRGFAWFQKGEYTRAIADFSRVIELEPESALAFNNRGYNRQMLGQYPEAVADYAAAIKIDPDYVLAVQNLAWLWSTADDAASRNGERALKAATKACELTEYKDVASLRVLAAALAESGDFGKAIEWQQKVVQLVPDDHKREEQEALDKYTVKEPLRVVALSN